LFTKQGCSGILKKEMLEKSYRLVLRGFSKKEAARTSGWGEE